MGQGNNTPIWQLTGKPITADIVRQREYLSVIRGEHYLVGSHFLEIEKCFVDCAGCKSDAHPAHMCPPFPKTEDWMGPTPDNAERFLKRIDGSSGQKEKGSPSRRGGRGYPSRGDSSRGGWQTVSRSRR
jgi:hypothetical protein